MHKKNISRLISLVILLLMVLAAGCSQATPTTVPAEEKPAPAETEAAAPEEPEETAPAEAEETAPEEEGIKIGYVVHVTGIEFTAIVEEGAQDAAENYGVELVFTGPPDIDHPAQIAAFDSLVEAGVDGIVFIAGDPSVWEEPVKRAVEKGVVVLNADADAPETERLAFFGVDAKGLGRILGDKVRDQLDEQGKLEGAKIVLGECVIGPAPHVLREEGFREAFEGENIEFVGPYETICDATQNYSNWQNAYTANQDAAAFVGLTAVETASLGKLKEETGGEFIVASFDPGAEGLRLMMDGAIDVTVGQNPYLAGYTPVQALARHFEEELEITPGENLYPGELILPEDAEALIDREGGGEPRTAWYANFIEENNLEDFGLGAEGEAEAEVLAVEVKSPEDVKLGYVVHVTGIEFTAIVEEGAQDAAKDYGVELVFTGPPDIDHPAQIAAFDSLIEAGVDGIVFIAGDPSVWEEPVKRAVEKGVVVLNADADAPDTERLAFFGVDAKGLGLILGDKVRDQLEEQGKLEGAKIVLGECVIGPAPHVLREEGFREAFEGDNVEFVGPYETICDATQNYSNWQNAYTANQDAAAFVGLTAVETASLGKLKEETGGEFIVASFDPGAEGLRLMMDGNIDVTVGQNPYLAGYTPIQALVRHFTEGLEIIPGENLYPGELILPEDAEALIEREGGGEPRTAWYAIFIEEKGLQDFGLKVP